MKFKALDPDNPPLADLRYYTEKEFKIIWVSDYYDGELSGMLQLNRVLYWFEMFDQNEDWQKGGWFRRYAIIQPSDEQLNKELEVHRDFQRYVGTHWDRHFIKTPPEFVPDQSKVFYEKHSAYVASLRFEENEVIGWFEF